jgi:hypothetical protein
MAEEAKSQSQRIYDQGCAVTILTALRASHAATITLWQCHVEAARLEREGAAPVEQRACAARLADAWTAVAAAKVAVDAVEGEEATEQPDPQLLAAVQRQLDAERAYCATLKGLLEKEPLKCPWITW